MTTSLGPVSDPSADCSWVALVHVVDQPGALMALSSVFAERGVNFTSLATGAIDGNTGTIALTFDVSLRQCQVIERVVRRLTVVRDVRVCPMSDPGVRAAGVVTMPPGVAFRPPADARVSWSGDSAAGQPVLFEGPYEHVVRVITAAREAGALVTARVIIGVG